MTGPNSEQAAKRKPRYMEYRSNISLSQNRISESAASLQATTSNDVKLGGGTTTTSESLVRQRNQPLHGHPNDGGRVVDSTVNQNSNETTPSKNNEDDQSERRITPVRTPSKFYEKSSSIPRYAAYRSSLSYSSKSTTTTPLIAESFSPNDNRKMTRRNPPGTNTESKIIPGMEILAKARELNSVLVTKGLADSRSSTHSNTSTIATNESSNNRYSKYRANMLSKTQSNDSTTGTTSQSQDGADQAILTSTSAENFPRSNFAKYRLQKLNYNLKETLEGKIPSEVNTLNKSDLNSTKASSTSDSRYAAYRSSLVGKDQVKNVTKEATLLRNSDTVEKKNTLIERKSTINVPKMTELLSSAFLAQDADIHESSNSLSPFSPSGVTKLDEDDDESIDRYLANAGHLNHEYNVSNDIPSMESSSEMEYLNESKPAVELSVNEVVDSLETDLEQRHLMGFLTSEATENVIQQNENVVDMLSYEVNNFSHVDQMPGIQDEVVTIQANHWSEEQENSLIISPNMDYENNKNERSEVLNPSAVLCEKNLTTTPVKEEVNQDDTFDAPTYNAVFRDKMYQSTIGIKEILCFGHLTISEQMKGASFLDLWDKVEQDRALLQKSRQRPSSRSKKYIGTSVGPSGEITETIDGRTSAVPVENLDVEQGIQSKSDSTDFEASTMNGLKVTNSDWKIKYAILIVLILLVILIAIYLIFR